VDGTTRVASTRATGDFFLDSLPSGTQTVSIRLLGYAPVEEAVDLSAREPQNVTIRMTDFVPVLETVRVTASRERALDAVGFTRRKRSGMGHYLDGDAINTNALHFSDAMRIVPGLRTVPVGGRQMIVSSRGINGCVQMWMETTGSSSNQATSTTSSSHTSWRRSRCTAPRQRRSSSRARAAAVARLSSPGQSAVWTEANAKGRPTRR
jgi:hypothetical protein